MKRLKPLLSEMICSTGDTKIGISMLIGIGQIATSSKISLVVWDGPLAIIVWQVTFILKNLQCYAMSLASAVSGLHVNGSQKFPHVNLYF